jgi:hypothetical protein
MQEGDLNVAEALTIVTLDQTTFGLVGLYFVSYIGEAGDLEDI